VAAQEPTTELVPVTLVVEPPPGRIVTTELPSVQALFSGTAGELFKLFLTPPVIRKEITTGAVGSHHQIELSPQDMSLGTEAAVTAQDVLPRRFDIELDSLHRKTVPVDPQISVLTEAGYERVGMITISPESVTVSGPLSIVRDLTFVPTVALNLSRVRGSFQRVIPLDTTGLNRTELSPAEVEASLTVRAGSNTMELLAGVPVRVEPRRGGIWTSTPTDVFVRIWGPPGRVNRMTRDSVTVVAGPVGTGPTERVRLEVRVPAGLTAQAMPDSATVQRRDRA
jgi:hypothetical protein